MQRIPEPERMEELEQVAAYAAADFQVSDSAFINRFQLLCQEHSVDMSAGDLLLDLGCGPGNISERLAAAFPSCAVLGIDASQPMLETARQRLQSITPLPTNLAYQQLDLHDLIDMGQQNALDAGSALLPPSQASAVVSNSLLHHLHNPEQLWEATRLLGAPGALVHHRDLRRPSTPEAAVKLRERHLPSAPDVLQRDYLASLHAAFTTEEIRRQLDDAGLHTLKVLEVEDRYLDVVGRLS